MMGEGPERIFIPVCKDPKDHMFTFGPIGYVEVEKVDQCPILVESDDAATKAEEEVGRLARGECGFLRG